jgi:hypothetical protein
MQALIDFDGWRKWKDFAEVNGLKDPSKHAGAPIKPAKKALKDEATKKVEEKVPITATGEAPKVPDPKSSDGKGLEKVGSGDGSIGKAETKDFAAPPEAVNDAKVDQLQKEASPDTVAHVPAGEKNTATEEAKS